MERRDIEDWVAKQPEILGLGNIKIITAEYNKFNKTKERFDLLALDQTGNLVVIELKRDDSGKDVVGQVIKYAAYCSRLTLEEVAEINHQYLKNLKNDT